MRSCEHLSVAKDGSLLQYLWSRDGLPDRKGSLLPTIPAQAIAWANQEEQTAADKDIQVRERRKTRRIQCYSPKNCWHREVCFPTQHRCCDAHESWKHRDPFHNPPFSKRMWTKFAVIYFGDCPRPQKLITQKYPKHKFFRITVL